MKDPVFRLSAKAIIVEGDQLLAIHCRDESGEFYYLPGGGQEYGETVVEALIRECEEEIGCTVIPGEIMFVRDYMGWEYEFADIEGHIHQVELMFRCQIADGERPTETTIPDDLQIGYAWLPLAGLSGCRFYPMAMRGELVEAMRTTEPRPAKYLGAVN